MKLLKITFTGYVNFGWTYYRFLPRCIECRAV